MRATASTPVLPWTDGVRALACATVVVWHVVLTVRSAAGLGSHPATAALGAAAHSAVLVFIVLSGYLLGRHWRGGPLLPETWRFVRRRTWRIVPPFWAALSVTVVAMLVLGLRHPGGTHWDVGLPMTWGRGALNYLMLTDVAGIAPFSHPLWTVPLEYHLYLLAPLVLLLSVPASRLRPTSGVALSGGVALVLGAAGAVAVALSDPPDFLPPLFVLAFTTAFATGVHRQSLAAAPPRVVLGLVGPVAVVAVLVAAGVVGAGVLDDGPGRYMLLDAALLPLLLAWLLVGDLAPQPGASRRWLATRPLRWGGDRSYSLYLLHGVLIEAAWRHLVEPLGLSLWTSGALLLLVASAGTGLLGEVLYRVVERPSARRSSSVGRARARAPQEVR